MGEEFRTGARRQLTLVAGHAKLPKDASARAVYEVLSIVVLADPVTGAVHEVDTTLVTTPAKRFLRELLGGRTLNDPPQSVIADVEQYYWGGAKKALLAAVANLFENWQEFTATRGTPTDSRGATRDDPEV